MQDITQTFTTHLKNVLTRAMAFAVEQNLARIEPAHLLWALADEHGSIAAELLTKAGAEAGSLRATLLDSSATPAVETQGTIPDLAETTKQTIEKAVLAAHRHGHRYVGTEHLLFALLELSDSDIRDRFPWLSLSEGSLRQHLSLLFANTKGFPDLQDPGEAHEDHEHGFSLMQQEQTNDEESKTPALDFFAIELTNEEELENLPPTIGREAEMERVMHILSRKTKNNPVLLGDPGVGKTAVVEGLARRIVEGNIPATLAKKRIFQLDLGALVAGTMYRGDFESRMRQLMDELEDHEDVILFIDEIHTILGAGAANGSLDAANLLKPALARGLARVVGATTPAEYKRAIESDGALERRFEPVAIPEPSLAQTREVLEGVKAFYQTFHAVCYTQDAIDTALALSEKYLPSKRFPDKAIDLLDEAGAGAHMQEDGGKPAGKTVHQLRGALERIISEKKEAVLAEKFEEAQTLRAKEAELQKALEIQESWEPKRAAVTVTEKEIRSVVSKITGISLTLLADEQTRLKSLAEELGKRILGQEHAVAKVAHAMRRAKLGISPTNKPLASFLFLGPSGVGKTELARALADLTLFEPRAFLRLDMSEYAESYSVSKLLGSPAGYVGYRDQATLADHVKQYPGAILLFDEIEKAHPDVQHLLLQILDHGMLRDATGRPIHFHQTTVVATTNAGRDALERPRLGFGEEETQEDQEKRARQILLDLFSPELVHRFDHLCLFRSLEQKTLEGILKKQLQDFEKRLENHAATLIVQDTALATLLKDLPSVSGAREIERRIREQLEHPVADHLLTCRKKPPHHLRIQSKKTGLILQCEK